MNENSALLDQLGLLTIDGYKFEKMLGGGSALSALYCNGSKKVVFKFLISPRNKLELERFKLEFSVLEKNKMNWFEGIDEITPRPSRFVGPEESYPLPRVSYQLKHKFNNNVSYFGYNYEEGILLSDINTSAYDLEEKSKLLHRIASALNYFNQSGYSHRDLHPENILLLPNPTMPTNERHINNPKVKILDMGSCQKIITETDYLYYIERDVDEDSVYLDNNKRLLASFTSMPPDFLEKGGEIQNYDSWSFGVFAYNILFDEMPFTVNTIRDVTLLREARNFSNNFNSNLDSLGIGYKAILKHLLSPIGEERPTIDTIVRLFSWLIHYPGQLDDNHFVSRVIHHGGSDPDPDYEARDDYF